MIHVSPVCYKELIMNMMSPGESKIETRYIVMPHHTNHYGTAFGGVIMSWIDIIAAMAAEKHCRREVVTVSIDTITFLVPILIGDHVILQSCVSYVGNTSMEVEVEVYKENPHNGDIAKATTAYVTFVGLDKTKKPVKVPELNPKTPEDIKKYERAKLRVQARKEMQKKLAEYQSPEAK